MILKGTVYLKMTPGATHFEAPFRFN